MTNLLESCRIAPPPHTVADQSLPLTFLDIKWLPFHPIRCLLFYDLPHSSKPYFLETIIPKLKESLSLTLKHFFPLAGNIVYPLNPEKKPEICYRAGDSVSLTFFESSDDYDDLVGNHPRNADKFYDLIPFLSQITNEESAQKLLEVLAIQVTLFSGSGVCIGFSNHHSVGDANSMMGFMRSWALINNNGEEEQFLITHSESRSFPVFDRSLINYPHELDSVFFKQSKKITMASSSFPLPTNRVRATYDFPQSKIKKLKDLVHARFPRLAHVSSFVVMAAYVWSCLAKSMIASFEEKVVDDDDKPDFFLFAVDARARIDPPVPGNYFGNCLSFGLAKMGHRELVGEEGFFAAAKAIAEEIRNKVIDKENLFEGAENWLAEVGAAVRNRKMILSVSGSSRADLYGVDFGWGRARKLETLSIDGERDAMSLFKSRNCEGGLEIGLSLPKVIMDAFAAHFSEGVKGE
ncbi:hypothetical protein ACS0TY_017535 [Phlomoides rotata]